MEVLSPYIVAGVGAWTVAQASKYIFASIKTRKMASLRHLYFSGNMPSAHSATVVAVTTIIGVVDGVGSGLFGLAVVFSSVVLYDAMMVRRSSGEQGVAITALIKERKSSVRLPRVAKGHTPLEVVVGSIVGLVVGLVVATLSLT